tara:strand:- start:307 stop:657 length:351 start_codon:yes stop_codon:yes gene_type:complete
MKHYSDKTETELLELSEQLCEDISNAMATTYPHAFDRKIKGHRVNNRGSKYIKILETENGEDTRVWGFINKGNPDYTFGAVMLAASWSGPAKNASRGNLFDGYKIAGMRLFGPDYL